MESSTSMPQWRGTTIISVRKGNQVVIAGDGQVTLGNVVIKSQARKVRRLAGGNVIAGFAGATADAFTLFENYPDSIYAMDYILRHLDNFPRNLVQPELKQF